jgi:hypothetical protein
MRLFRCCRSFFSISLVVLFSLPLSACSQDKKITVSYKLYNHTSVAINSVIVNGEGGILNAMAYGGGGEACCVVLPSEWRSDLKVTIKWEEDGDWLKDEKGNFVIRDGSKVYVPKPYKEKIVDVPKYAGGDKTGAFRIHIFPNDEVKVTVLLYGPGHPDYPYPSPRDSKN